MRTAFEFKQVSAGYQQVTVLNNLNFTIAEGEILALLGPNGAGKTTLINVLTGLHPVTMGTVELFGGDVRKLRASERARLIAVVPQELKTSMSYTIKELVMMSRTALLMPWEQPTTNDRHIVERSMVYTDIIELGKRSLETLSGGEKQRTVIAMALAQEPRIIVMDEPTTHLDINHSLEIMQLIERLNLEQGVTVLITSHDLNLASEFCHRLLLLDHGKLVADGSPTAVLDQNILKEVYHCDLRIQADAQTGSLIVVPARRLTPISSTTDLQVHVIAGGGSGADVLRRLCLCGYRVSCGVLNLRDTDTQAAEALNTKLATEKPFSPIGAAAIAEAGKLADAADVIVLCAVPFGPGNVINLSLAEQALQRGIPVLINDASLENRDFCADYEASRKIKQMRDSGAIPWHNINELMNALAQYPKK